MIKLTELPHEFSYYVNPDHIIWIMNAPKNQEPGSYVYTTGRPKEHVKETPEEILDLIDQQNLPRFNTVYNTSEYKGK